jgi:hypothetical protein
MRALRCATVRPVRRDTASRRKLVLPHPQHEIFSPAVESCSLHAEVTEFPRICRDVSKWHQPRHATIRPHTGATKSYLCTRLNHLTSFLEINHACIDCPLDPQRLARLNGTTDDCAGGFGYVDIGNSHSARCSPRWSSPTTRWSCAVSAQRATPARHCS